MMPAAVMAAMMPMAVAVAVAMTVAVAMAMAMPSVMVAVGDSMMTTRRPGFITAGCPSSSRVAAVHDLSVQPLLFFFFFFFFFFF
jgi:hypothetical protein